MTDRDKHIAHKKKELLKISKQQAKLITKAAKIVSKQYKSPETHFKRLMKVVELTMQVRALGIQKQIIASQPIPKITSFLPGGPAIVGESSPELIITHKGKIETR